MGSNINSLFLAHQKLGNRYAIEDKCLSFVTSNNVRIEIVGIENSMGMHHYNIFAMQNAELVAEELGVTLENLPTKVHTLLKVCGGE